MVNIVNSNILPLLIYILIAGLLFLLPYIVFPTLPFGVRIPLAYAHDPSIVAERRLYTLRLGILAGGLFLADIALPSLVGWETLVQFSTVILVLGGWGVYYLSHRHLSQIKISQRWFADARQAVMANAIPRSKIPTQSFWVFLALPCVVLILTTLIGVWRYPKLPANLHFVFPGSLGDWTLTATPINAFLPVIFQCLFTLLFAGFAWVRGLGSQSIDVEDPAGSQRYQQINIQVVQVLLLLLALGFNSALLVAGLAGWGLLQANFALTNAILLTPLTGWLIVAPILLMGLRPNPRTSAQKGGYVNRDDDHFWKLGLFYFNREDPSLIVNRRFGIGRTLNFGNSVAWIIVAGIAVFILVRIWMRL